MVVAFAPAPARWIDPDDVDATRLGRLPDLEHGFLAVSRLLDLALHELFVERIPVPLVRRPRWRESFGDFQCPRCWKEATAAGDEALPFVPRVVAQHVLLGSVLALASPPCDLLRFDEDAVVLLDVARPCDLLIVEATVPIDLVVGVGLADGVGRVRPEADED